MIITYVKSNETESWRTIGDGKHCWAGGSHHEIVGNLDGRSVYLNDLRRVGKTMILRKMEAHPPAGWLAVKRDLGGFHSAAEFATWAFRDSLHILNRKTRFLRRMSRLLGKLEGIEVAGVLKLPNGTPVPWKEVLIRTFADLEDELSAIDAHLVFLWDEVPFLLDNVSKREGPPVAMEILDVLRSLGQDHSRVRLVLTGSVGLHHVLTDLRGKGYMNSPLNHMERIAPGPLSSPDAIRLAGDLLSGAGIQCSQPKACARAVATSVGNVAFYIHKLISRIPKSKKLTPALVETILQKEIADADNDWDFAHYRTRLRLYYGAGEGVVLHILDSLAVADDGLSLNAIRKQVASMTDLGGNEQLLDLLKLLQQDHYLDRDDLGHYKFRFPLIRRWWRFDRSLQTRAS